MFRARRVAAAIVLGSILAQGLVVPALAGESKSAQLIAYLDGRPIPLADVSKYYCDDFSYPAIRCSTVPLITDLRAGLTAMATGIDYVTIYDGTNFSTSYMNVSQDYASLMTIGWNDKISSFKGRNGETGTFWTDWFNTGSTWPFCCNTQQTQLGGYNNTFSSIART